MTYHFIGVAGSGMSPLARFLAARGERVSGSDRFLDRQPESDEGRALAGAGVTVFPQDGSFVQAGPPDRVVVSSAIEEENPDLAAAGRAGIAVRHRAEILAGLVNEAAGIAVAGSAGKTTTAGMIAWALNAGGGDPALVNGAGVIGLPGPGDVLAGRGPFVAEADESDGSLEHFAPRVGLVTGADRDHAELDRVREMFAAFAGRTKETLLLNADGANLAGIEPAAGVRLVTFGFDRPADFRGEALRVTETGTSFRVGEADFRVNLPGEHNARNALAAAAALRTVGVPPGEAARLLAGFPGVRRRLELVAAVAGARVFDDFAHNPDKIRAAVRATRPESGRLVALFRPHGFGPARFHREGLRQVFREELRPGDALLYLPIYDAGGTADRSIGADDLAADLDGAPFAVRLATPESAPAAVRELARAGDTVLLMGARDPGLPALARELGDVFQ